MRALLLLGLGIPSVATATDLCPADPGKTAPGLCGCGVVDSDWDADGQADSCVDGAASVDPSVAVGRGARVDAGAVVHAGAALGGGSHVGAGAVIGARTGVGAKASVGAGAELGEDGTVGRRAQVGAGAQLGDGAQLGRASRVGARTTAGAGLLLGYAASLGEDVRVEFDGLRVGNLASVGDRCVVGGGTTVGRGAAIGADCALAEDTRVGPDVVAGAELSTGLGARILRGASLGARASLGLGAAVGRDASLGDDVSVGERATIRAGATIGAWAVVAEEAVVPRDAVVPPGNTPPSIDAVSGPTTLAFNASAALSATAIDAQPAQVLTWAWSFSGPSTGWSLVGADTPTPTLSVGGAGSAASVTVQLAVSDGLATTTATLTVALSAVTARSCKDHLNNPAGTGSGLYTIDPTGSSPFTVYCELDPLYDGGGWTLISNRRAAATETGCGSRIMDMFTAGCGAPSAIGAAHSYALSATRRNSLPKTEMLLVQFLGGVLDADDAYIVQLGAVSDPFPNVADLRNHAVAGACNLSRTSCDTSNVVFKYTGDSWYHSSTCDGTYASSTGYRGNYGLCLNGTGDSGNSSRFFGNREGYAETKLWGYDSSVGHTYQERIFYR